MEKQEYIFIDKSLFFPKQGILVVGDLHIGFEYMLQQSGVLVPERQVEGIIKELEQIFKTIKKRKLKLNKIIFIGDIKHSFGFEWQEKNYFNEVLEFLSTKFKDRDIILLKGNHDTIDYSFERKMKLYHLEDDLMFIHGHKAFPNRFDKKIKTLVMGHIHPSVILSDKQNIKREKYKCFLTGRFKGKEIVVLPSFLATIEGLTINEVDSYENYFSIIPKKALLGFTVHVIGEKEIYEFGRVRDLVKN